MSNRRKFIKNGLLAGAGLGIFGSGACTDSKAVKTNTTARLAIEPPIVVSTWRHGIKANAAAWAVLGRGGTSLDAVEQGARITEADPTVESVGYGGMPDREGHLTLDASIMDHTGNCGSVSFLEGIRHPISVARLVMDKTPHVMLSGQGALQFAIEQGFQREDLLTETARQKLREWQVEKKYQPVINVENHDTIGLLALDGTHRLAGACTTSGLAFKMRGRVGDSPVIGAGLYVDGEVGAATATGMGEAMLKTLGSFLVVEFMRAGKSPTEACRLAVERIIEKVPEWKDIQVAFIALDKTGQHGAYAVQPDFGYAIRTRDTDEYLDVPSIL